MKQDSNTPETTKKTRLGLIAVIVAAILFVFACGSLAFWYFGVYSKPETVVLDAMRQLLTAENVAVNGTAMLGIDSFIPEQTIISLASTPLELPTSASLKIGMLKVGGQPIEWAEEGLGDATEENDDFSTFDADAVISKNGELYLRLSNIREVVRDTITGPFVNDGEADDNYADELAEFELGLYNFADTINGEWIKISLEDLLEMFGLDGDSGRPLTNGWACIMNTLSSRDLGKELSPIYENHPFILAEKTGSLTANSSRYSTYSASFDYEQLADFLKALAGTDYADALMTCCNNTYTEAAAARSLAVEDEYLLSSASFSAITAEQIQNLLPADLTLELVISDGGHRLSQADLQFTTQNEQTYLTTDVRVSLGFEYDKAIEVQLPSTYRPLSSLAEEIIKLDEERLEYTQMSGSCSSCEGV